ncbi:acid protease [Mycena rebaudengoi]|nr:acid protease [Mycena rebaudengoi]
MATQNPTHNVAFNTRMVNMKEILVRDRARAQHLVACHQPHGPTAFHNTKKPHHPIPPAGSSSGSQNTTMSATDAAVTYVADVGVGSPPTTYSLLLDTGSSNTWIVNTAQKPYKQTSTSTDMRKEFKITYGLGSCSGTEYNDQVTMGPKLVIKDQSIGVADKCDHMDGIDGIMDTMAPDSTNTNGIPTVTNNMLKQKLISSECVGISYIPTTSANAANGSLSFGCPDSSKYTGDLNYVPITKTSPACNYWGIEQTVSYGTETILPPCAGIVDTGTTLCMLATQAFQAYQKATGAVMDNSLGLLTVTEEQYAKMQSMCFNIGSVKYEFTKNAQIFPRSMNAVLGAPPNKICLIMADMGELSGQGLDFINGFAFLQRFYSVYDTTNCQTN